MREGERKGCGESENSQASLVPRPTCAFYFSAAVGLFTFSHVCDAEGRRVKFSVSKESCSSQTTKEGSESTLLVATLWSPFVPQTEQ